MKKRLLRSLLVLMAISCMTSCGSRKDEGTTMGSKSSVSDAIYEEFDRYSRAVRDYEGKYVCDVGYTSPEGYKYDVYGDIKLPLRIAGPNGENINVSDGDLSEYVVVNQYPEAKTEIKISYTMDEKGNEYEHYPKEISVKEIILYIEKEK
ncbi:MAG: hypothetical protein MJ105_06655 [Lachnospiraceae bacterium]|nr:hypothetical protein [Lachnospiraceae bacterium]